jgi:hypothetical protein
MEQYQLITCWKITSIILVLVYVSLPCFCSCCIIYNLLCFSLRWLTRRRGLIIRRIKQHHVSEGLINLYYILYNNYRNMGGCMFLYSTYSVEKIKCKHQEFLLKLCLSENKTLKTDVEYQALFLKWLLWEIQFKTNAILYNNYRNMGGSYKEGQGLIIRRIKQHHVSEGLINLYYNVCKFG